MCLISAAVLRHERRAQLRHVDVAAAAARAARHVGAAELLRAGRAPLLPQPRAAQRLPLPGPAAQPAVQICAGTSAHRQLTDTYIAPRLQSMWDILQDLTFMVVLDSFSAC